MARLPLADAAAPDALAAPPAHAAWFAAVKDGDVAAVAALMTQGAHRDAATGGEARCERGGTALMWSAAHGHAPLTQLLLSSHSCDVEARCSRAGGTALIWAASRNQTHTLALLLKAGADAGRPALPLPGAGYNAQVRPSRAGRCADVARVLRLRRRAWRCVRRGARCVPTRP